MAQRPFIRPVQQPTEFTLTDQPKPEPKPKMELPKIWIEGLRSDDEYDAFMAQHKASKVPVLIQFGSTWCQKCHEILPTFVSLSKQYSQLRYAVAQVDMMQERAKGIRYSPYFAIYKGGRKVDEVTGKEPQRLADHIWLHSDE